MLAGSIHGRGRWISLHQLIVVSYPAASRGDICQARELGGRSVTFAAAELSNGVWGFLARRWQTRAFLIREGQTGNEGSPSHYSCYRCEPFVDSTSWPSLSGLGRAAIAVGHWGIPRRKPDCLAGDRPMHDGACPGIEPDDLGPPDQEPLRHVSRMPHARVSVFAGHPLRQAPLTALAATAGDPVGSGSGVGRHLGPAPSRTPPAGGKRNLRGFLERRGDDRLMAPSDFVPGCRTHGGSGAGRRAAARKAEWR